MLSVATVHAYANLVPSGTNLMGIGTKQKKSTSICTKSEIIVTSNSFHYSMDIILFIVEPQTYAWEVNHVNFDFLKYLL